VIEEIHCYAYAEDELSCEVVRRLVEYQNLASETGVRLKLVQGFPDNKHGFTQIKNRIPAILKMASNGIATLILTDLDRGRCAPELIGNWTGLGDKRKTLPPRLWFRVAVRETESWVLADRAALAMYFGIAANNFDLTPDQLIDPKEYFLNVIQAKCRNKSLRQILPLGNANIGPSYNQIVCTFVRTIWDPERAAAHSPSLKRALMAMKHFR
jgi:hypothetical protein